MEVLKPSQLPGIEQASAFAESICPELVKVGHRFCMQCDEAHCSDPRKIAHARHINDQTICWSHAVCGLPIEHQIGIALHEYGHILADESGCGNDFDIEAAADLAVLQVFGIEIKYVGDLELQWVSEEALRNA